MVDQTGEMERDCRTDEANQVEHVGEVFELSELTYRCTLWRASTAIAQRDAADVTMDRFIKEVLDPLAPVAQKVRLVDRVVEAVKIPAAFIGGVVFTLAAGYAWARIDATQ